MSNRKILLSALCFCALANKSNAIGEVTQVASDIVRNNGIAYQDANQALYIFSAFSAVSTGIFAYRAYEAYHAGNPFPRYKYFAFCWGTCWLGIAVNFNVFSVLDYRLSTALSGIGLLVLAKEI